MLADLGMDGCKWAFGMQCTDCRDDRAHAKHNLIQTEGISVTSIGQMGMPKKSIWGEHQQ